METKLPEHTKQSIENQADEYIKQYLPYVDTTGHWLGFQDGYKQALIDTGSVAAPNIEKEIRNKAIDDCIEKLKLIVNGSELTGELESLKI
jgi:hypothetical protein